MPGIEWGRDFAGYQVREKYGNFEVVGYAESSYAGDLKDKNLVTGYYLFFGGAIVT